MFDLLKVWSSLWSARDEPEFNYAGFRIQNFRGKENASISLRRSNLALLLGLNESGKTSLLKAIEFFDYRNDPVLESKPAFFKGMRNKQDVDSNDTVFLTATFAVKRHGDVTKIKRKAFEKASPLERQAIDQFIELAAGGNSFYHSLHSVRERLVQA